MTVTGVFQRTESLYRCEFDDGSIQWRSHTDGKQPTLQSYIDSVGNTDDVPVQAEVCSGESASGQDVGGFNTFVSSSGKLVARGYANETGEQGIFTFPILLASPPKQLNIVGSIFTLWDATGGGASAGDPTPVLDVSASSNRWAVVKVPLIAGYDIPADSKLSIYAASESTSFEFTDEEEVAEEGSGLIPDTTFDQTFGATVNPSVNLSTGGILSMKIKLSAYDTHWGCIISGENFRLSHEGSYGTVGVINFEYKADGGWWHFGTFNSIKLELDVEYTLTFKVLADTEFVQVVIVSTLGTVSQFVTTGQSAHGEFNLTAVGRNDTVQGTINYLMADVSNVIYT